jgi:hypothetical protein
VRDPEGRPIDLVRSPFHIAAGGGTGAEKAVEPTCPPGLGEHTDAILGELCGLEGAELAELRRAGVIG